MGQLVSITNLNTEVDSSTAEYITEKVKKLYRYIPRNSREGARFEVKLKEISETNEHKVELELILIMPEKTMTASGKALTFKAAIDGVEEKMEGQLRRHKTETIKRTKKGGMMSRFKRFMNTETSK